MISARSLIEANSELVITQLNNGTSFDEIAKTIGVSRKSISRWSAVNGITRDRITIEGNAKKIGIDNVDIWVSRMYLDEKMSGNAMAKKLGVSGVALYVYMDKLGISKRSISEAKKLEYAKASDEERDRRNKNSVDGRRIAESKLSSDELMKRRSDTGKRTKAYWDNATDDDHLKMREATSRGARKRLEGWSGSQKKECIDRLIAGHRRHYSGLSMDEKRASMMHAHGIFRERYNTDDAFKAECIRKSLAAQNFRESGPERTAKAELLKHGLVFEDQFQLGFYSIDIAFPDIKLAVEIDGEYWHSLPSVVAKDKRKNSYIRNYCGWDLLRIPAMRTIHDLDAMTNEIIDAVHRAFFKNIGDAA